MKKFGESKLFAEDKEHRKKLKKEEIRNKKIFIEVEKERKKNRLKIKPTGNKLLLKKVEEEISPGGLFIPQGIQFSATIAVVLDTGPGYETNEKGKWEPCLIKKDQIVILNKEAGLKIPKDLTHDCDLILVGENQIFGIVENYESVKKNTRKSQ